VFSVFGLSPNQRSTVRDPPMSASVTGESESCNSRFSIAFHFSPLVNSIWTSFYIGIFENILIFLFSYSNIKNKNYIISIY
jgi:hypothetical protein